MRASRLSLLLCLACVFFGATASAAGPAREPFFPGAGSHGYDAIHYRSFLFYEGRFSGVRATEKVTVRATARLQDVSLDLYGQRVTSAEVDGTSAEFSRGPGHKLIIELPEAAVPGQRFGLLIHYEGRPVAITDPDGTKDGWIPTDDGAVALGEPQGTAAWLACNNIPGDKATFSVTISVPRPLVGVSNGHLTAVESAGNRRRFEWKQTDPMSTYLALVDIGRGVLVKSRIAGHPAWTLLDPRLAKGSRRVLDKLPEVIRFESKSFGRYPFDDAGSVVDPAPQIEYALETQTRPFYPYVPDLTTVVHETAHQWFGDSVGLKRWPNIWLNEGFATWTEWYYAERHGLRSAHAIFNRLYRVPASNTEFWDPPSGHPGTPAHLFGPSVYVRGAMALEALRLKIGTKPMLRVLRRWAVTHRYGSGDIEEFVELAKGISGQDLDPLFHRWLYRRGKP